MLSKTIVDKAKAKGK